MTFVIGKYHATEFQQTSVPTLETTFLESANSKQPTMHSIDPVLRVFNDCRISSILRAMKRVVHVALNTMHVDGATTATPFRTI